MVTISTSKLSSLLILTLLLSSLGASQAYDLSGFEDGSYFSAPEYDSQRELVLNILFPFVLIYAVMQFTLFNLMKFTINSNDNITESEIGRYSTILAAAIPAMLIVSPMWKTIVKTVNALGPVVLVGFGAAMLYVFNKMR